MEDFSHEFTSPTRVKKWNIFNPLTTLGDQLILCWESHGDMQLKRGFTLISHWRSKTSFYRENAAGLRFDKEIQLAETAVMQIK